MLLLYYLPSFYLVNQYQDVLIDRDFFCKLLWRRISAKFHKFKHKPEFKLIINLLRQH